MQHIEYSYKIHGRADLVTCIYGASFIVFGCHLLFDWHISNWISSEQAAVNLFCSAKYCANINFSELCYKVNMFCALFQTDPRHGKLDLQ